MYYVNFNWVITFKAVNKIRMGLFFFLRHGITFYTSIISVVIYVDKI